MTKAHWEWTDDYNENLYCECGGVVNEYGTCTECEDTAVAIVDDDLDKEDEDEGLPV